MSITLTTGSFYGIDLTCRGVSEDNTNCTQPNEVFFPILEIQFRSTYYMEQYCKMKITILKKINTWK